MEKETEIKGVWKLLEIETEKSNLTKEMAERWKSVEYKGPTETQVEKQLNSL